MYFSKYTGASARVVLLFAAALLLGPRAQAVNLLVYNNNDSGAGSLRQAISDNHALDGGNTILFSNVVTGTITLTSGELFIDKDLTLLGPGANLLSISGHAGRVFHITNSTASISGVTVTNGYMSGFNSGGGIFNDHSTLTISNCNISGNFAGSYGGGIWNYGALPGNAAALTIVASTLSSNTVVTGGGGSIFNDAGGNPGGGHATLAISNCTFYGNSGGAGGGIENLCSLGSYTLATLVGCTMSGNTASGYGDNILLASDSSSTALADVGNCIFNTSGSRTNIANLKNGLVTFTPNAVVSYGYNLSSDNGSGYLTNVADQINTNPQLGPLQNNGGPTLTMLPLTGSPAIDQGKSSGLTTDQRGRTRSYDSPTVPNAAAGDGTDIGAAEVSPAMTLVVSNTNDSATGSLRQAIADSFPGDFITFAPAVTGAIKLTSPLVISNGVNVLGPGARTLAVDGNGSNQVLYVEAGSVLISGLTITNGRAGAGGGIFNSATLTVSNCAVVGNVGSPYGGGIRNQGLLKVWNSTIAQNMAISTDAFTYGTGGGLFNDSSGSAVLVNCTIANNSSMNTSNSQAQAGGIYNAALLSLTNCTVANNTTVQYGGGLYITAVSVPVIAGSIVASNTASILGPDIYGTISSGGYNLIGKTNDSAGYGATGDQLGSTSNPISARLSPLGDYGGPTPTMALLSNSPAIDKGKSFGVTTDQRGAPRPYDFSTAANASAGDGSDIGAFELGAPALNIRKSANNAVLSWQSYYGDFTLQSVTNVIASNSWANVAGTPAVVANQYVLTNGPISGNKFYRLKGN